MNDQSVTYHRVNTLSNNATSQPLNTATYDEEIYTYIHDIFPVMLIASRIWNEKQVEKLKSCVISQTALNSPLT